MTEPSFTVAVIDPSRARAAILEEGLRAAGIADVVIIPDTADLPAQVAALNPDVVVIHLESPSRDILEQMSGLSRHVERPVAMFVDRSDAPMMQAAVDAGISAYVVDGLHPQRIRSILDIAILRFNAFARLQRELDEARSELADRKLIERAKGILMNLKGLTEDEAYKQLRRKAMNEKRKIADIARAIGEPAAVRAVAMACGANRIAVAIPCHRVVRLDGSLSGYRWGVERKRDLLVREGARR